MRHFTMNVLVLGILSLVVVACGADPLAQIGPDRSVEAVDAGQGGTIEDCKSQLPKEEADDPIEWEKGAKEIEECKARVARGEKLDPKVEAEARAQSKAAAEAQNGK